MIERKVMTKKFAMALEGGGMRGMYTAGVLDTLMNMNIYADATVGVSAGAVFGCNYKSRQIGRTIRYNTAYCKDRRYASMKNWVKTGSVYDPEFAYEKIPNELDVFDRATFKESPMRFTVVCTDMETGTPAYFDCTEGGRRDLELMRASAAVPVALSAVEVEGRRFVDGGITDAVPYRRALSYGYEKTVVILTQPRGYIKEPNKLMPFLKRYYKDYPMLVRALEERHNMYNRQREELALLEEEGKIFVIRPSESVALPVVERDEKRLKRIYSIGCEDMKKELDRLKKYLA